MSIHKLTAGSGYDYLTRQVAAQDATEKGHTGLASYYAERGETPGQWIGSGMAGIDGLDAGDVVTAQQMQALFGSGHHPLAEQRREQLQGPGLSDRDYQGVTRLGVPFQVFSGDVVTAQQMQALFGSGHHLLAARRRERLQGPGLTDRDYQGVTRLGVPFKVFSGD